MKSIVGVVLNVCLLVGGCISCSESPSDIQRRGARHYNAGEFSQAVACFREAAEKGDAEGQWKLGVCYADGKGVEKNATEAVKWYRKAAEQGNAKAQLNLGMCYFSGTGIWKNARGAVKWLRKAAEQGSSRGQFFLGVCYFNGVGVKKNARKALKLFRKALEPKVGDVLIDEECEEILERMVSAEGYYCLGLCYYCGYGVARDEEKTRDLWRKAEEQGNEDATEALRKYFNE